MSLMYPDPVTEHVTAGLAMLEMLAVTVEGSCDLTSHPDPAVAPGLEDAPHGGVLVAQELVALCPALAPASDWSQPPPAVYAVALNPPVQPGGACRAFSQAPAKMGAPAHGLAVHAEVHVVPAVLRSVPATAAVALKWLVAHPMKKAECLMARQQLSQQGQDGDLQLFVAALEWPMDPWEAAEPPHEAASVPQAEQGGAADPGQHQTEGVQSDLQPRNWQCKHMLSSEDAIRLPCLYRYLDISTCSLINFSFSKS